MNSLRYYERLASMERARETERRVRIFCAGVACGVLLMIAIGAAV